MRMRHLLPLLPLALLAGCVDKPILSTPQEEEPERPIIPLGLYEVTLSGIGTPEMQTSVSPAPGSPSYSLGAAPNGLAIEVMSSSSFIDGVRGQGGHRYVSFMYRVRNLTGGPLTNVTYIPVETASSIPGTPFTAVRRFDNTNLPDSVARKIIPTGAVALGEETRMKAVYPDVLQAYEEAELLAISPPVGVTNIFPYGFVVRSPGAANQRTLPAGGGPNDWGGTLTFAYRVPLQPGGNSQDPFSITFLLMAVVDTETRMTESMEESADTAAVRRLRTHATKIGATTVTVLNGSARMDPGVANYPGQRQLCAVRTAGTNFSPLTLMNAPGPLANFQMLRPGQTRDGCAAYFRTGSPGRPATNVPFTVTAHAMDRYGNVLPVPDTVYLQLAAGSPPVTTSSPTALVAGAAPLTMTFSDYGTANVTIRGRRLFGEPEPVPVAGVTRTWTAGAGTTNWHTGGNWGLGAVPMSLDSVHIPAAPSGGSIFPLLASNVSIMGVTVENGATLSLSAFDLTAGANVATGTSGGINSTSGRLNLAGVARTVHGVVPLTRVIGTYSLTGNLTVSRRLEVNLGRLTNTSFRVQQNPF
jgi:hypothetical protein